MSFAIKQKIIRNDILLIFKTDKIVQSRFHADIFCSSYVIISGLSFGVISELFIMNLNRRIQKLTDWLQSIGTKD